MEARGYYNRLIEAREKYGDRVIAYDGRERLTYSGLLSGADAYGDKLAAMGVRPGDHVALCAFNCCSWLKAFFGIIKAGAVAVLLNYSLGAEEMKELYGDMDSVCFLYGRCGARNKDENFMTGIQHDESRLLDIDAFTYEEKNSFEPMEISEEALAKPAFIVFTSGSTGKPKGGLLTQNSSLSGAEAFMQIIPEMEGETLCMCVPLFHMFGFSLAVTNILYGGKLVLPLNFTNDMILERMEETRPDALAAVMTVITRLTEDERLSQPVSGGVKRIYTGGAPLMPIQLMRVERAFRNAVLLNNYGQTETDSSIAMSVPSDSFEIRVSAIGRPLPHREVVIMNSVGEPCPAGAVGEVTLFDNGLLCKGYYKLPPERQPIDSRGYLHTGDLGFLDADGYLHLSGRIKDIIIKGGENIIPGEIEAKINALDGVREVKVMGAPNELYGESVEACLTLSPEAKISGGDIKAALKGIVSGFKMPAHFFVFDSFPLKANGKLDACELKVRMLNKPNEARIEEEIVYGIPVLSISARSQRYIIGPICRAARDIMPNLGFSTKKAGRIVHCVEEMLIERVNNAYMESGTLSFEFRLWPDFMRVRFWDESPVMAFSNADRDEDQSLSVKIILGMTDRISFEKNDDGTMVYNFDYLYDTDFEAKEFFK